MHKTRILCVTSGYELYGSDRSFINSVLALKNNRNVYLKVIISKQGPLSEYLKNKVDELIIDKLSVIRRSEFKKLKFKSIFLLPINYFKARREYENFDILYINTITILEYILPQYNIKNYRKYIHVREIPTGLEKIFFELLLRVSRAKFIFNSFATMNNFSKYFINKKNSIVIYNGIEGYSTIRPIKDFNGKTNILIIGRISPRKGLHLFIKALLFNRDILNNISVRIVGGVFKNDVHYKMELEDYIRKENLGDIISIMPFSNNPIDHYEWSHIVIIPSTKPESFGLVAVEAMSAGRAVIAANHGGLTEIVDDMKTGILFNPCDATALFQAIEYLINNRNEIVKYGEAGKRKFKQYFTLNGYQKNISDIILGNNSIIN